MRRRFNVAPGDDVLAVAARRARPSREGTLLRWGLVPHWASDPREIGRQDDQRARRDRRRATRLPRRVRAPALPDPRRRLLRVVGRHAALDHARGRRAVRVRRAVGVVAPARRRRRRAAAHAARSSRPRRPGRCATLHDRMPVILDAADEARWLDPATPAGRPARAARAGRPGARCTRPVSRAVNDARHDAPDCLDPPEQAVAVLTLLGLDPDRARSRPGRSASRSTGSVASAAIRAHDRRCRRHRARAARSRAAAARRRR